MNDEIRQLIAERFPSDSGWVRCPGCGRRGRAFQVLILGTSGEFIVRCNWCTDERMQQYYDKKFPITEEGRVLQ